MMNKTNSLIRLLLIILFCCENASAWRAGFDHQELPATTHVKTSDKSVCMAGYGTLCWRSATGTHDPVNVQALFLTDENHESLIFISLDAIGFSQKLAKAVRERVAAETLLAEENVILTATHTHSSIDLQGLWGGLNDQQYRMIVDAIVETARSSWTNTHKVTLHVATSNQLKGFNRRTNNNDIIHQILTVQLRHEWGVPFVTMFTLGSHPVILSKDNTKLSSDWVHYARSVLNDELKAPALFINGALGDVLPGNDNPRNFDSAKAYGTDIARHILSSLDHSKELKSSLRHCSEVIEDKADNYTLILGTKAIRHGTVLWDGLFSKSYKTRTSVVIMDDLVLLTTPGEPVTAMGKSLTALAQDNPVAVLGLTHDSLGYLIPAQNIMKDGYEEKVMISHTLSGKVMDSLQKLTTECLGKKHEQETR